MPQTILLDTDIGTDVDDALTIVLAARSPEISLASVTTASGRTEVRARIARRLLDLAGCPGVPVTAGLGKPLAGDRFDVMFPDGIWMGHEGTGLLSDEEIEDASSATVDGEAAVASIVRSVTEAAVPVTVVTIGPVTNVAAALRHRPEIAARIGSIVVMGARVGPDAVPGGKDLHPIAEFNLNADREAAWTVLNSGVPLVVVPIELTSQTFLTDADVASLRGGDDAAKALADLLDVWAPMFRRLQEAMGGSPEELATQTCHLHDPLTLLAVIRPDLLGFEDVRLTLDVEDSMLLTRVDPAGDIPVRLATSMDWPGVQKVLLERFKGG